MAFTGFPVAALDFYDDLEVDNTRSFWDKRRAVYEEAVRAPMTALCAALGEEFGEAKVFRPHRDVRFAKDKTPYKTSQGAFVAVAPATGWYVQLSAQGVRVGGGFYEAAGPRLAAIRAAIAADRTGRTLQRHLTRLAGAGFEISGTSLKTTPRGYAADHPRIDLLRRRQLVVGRSYGFDPVIHAAELLERVRQDWRAMRPVVGWLQRATT